MMVVQSSESSRTELDRLSEEFLEHMEIERQASPLTIRNYKHYLGRFSEWFKRQNFKAKPSSIDLDKIKKYRVYLARFTALNGQPLSRSTQAYHVIALRSFLKWLNKNDYQTLSPEKVDIPKGKSRSVKFLSAEQVERLLSQPLPSLKTGLRDKVILEVLFSTGMRVSELVSLNRDQIDLQRREFGIVGKGREPRVVFLSERAVKWLTKYLASRQDAWKPLLINYRGKEEGITDGEKKRLTARSIQRIVDKYSKKARLPIKVTPHVLRHSFATDLLVAGADLRAVQEMLGHKSVQTTQIYTHVTNRQLRSIHETFHGKGK